MNTYTTQAGTVLDDNYFTAMRMIEKALSSGDITIAEAKEWAVKLGIEEVK